MAIKIDTNSLANLLLSLRKATIVSLHARTIPKMNKTNNPYFGRLEKLCRLTAVIGAQYGSAVNRRRVKEASAAGRPSVQHFQEGDRSWGRHARSGSGSSRPAIRSPLILYRGKRYLNLQRQTVLHVAYRYRATGRPLAAEKVEPFLRKSDPGRRQELKRPVVCRDYTLENVLELRMHGQVYVVESREPRVESRKEAA